MKARWSRTSTKTTGGRTFEVIYKTTYKEFEVTVTNYPGSRTLSWSVERGSFRNSREEDRYECTVEMAKEKALEHVDTLLARWARDAVVS